MPLNSTDFDVGPRSQILKSFSHEVFIHVIILCLFRLYAVTKY